MVCRIKCKERVPSVELYGDLPKLSVKIVARRFGLAGHCQSHPELPTNKLLWDWEPTQGGMERGQPTKTLVYVLMEDTGADNLSELRVLIRNRSENE